MKHFKKEKVNNPISFIGKPVTWQLVDNNVGVRELDDDKDAALIAELDRLADARKMGVVRVSAEIYGALRSQKKTQLTPSRGPLGGFEKIRLVPQEQNLIRSASPLSSSALVAPTVSAPPPTVPVNNTAPQPPEPITSFRPQRGRRSSLEKGTKVNEGGS